jgi:hypothetical protein
MVCKDQREESEEEEEDFIHHNVRSYDMLHIDRLGRLVARVSSADTPQHRNLAAPVPESSYSPSPSKCSEEDAKVTMTQC